jgi:hypothetical protein
MFDVGENYAVLVKTDGGPSSSGAQQNSYTECVRLLHALGRWQGPAQPMRTHGYTQVAMGAHNMGTHEQQ